MGDEVGFLSADKHRTLLQGGSITFGYQKQSLYNIFAISQGKREGWSWFFCLLTNVEGFFKLILCVAKHAQIT